MKDKERMIKMLTITLTKTALWFGSLNDEVYDEIKKLFPQLEENPNPNKKGYVIKGQPKELYDVLFHLSYRYDIEII